MNRDSAAILGITALALLLASMWVPCRAHRYSFTGPPAAPGQPGSLQWLSSQEIFWRWIGDVETRLDAQWAHPPATEDERQKWWRLDELALAVEIVLILGIGGLAAMLIEIRKRRRRANSRLGSGHPARN